MNVIDLREQVSLELHEHTLRWRERERAQNTHRNRKNAPSQMHLG